MAPQMSTNFNMREINGLAHAPFTRVSVWKRKERSRASRCKNIENKGPSENGFRTRLARIPFAATTVKGLRFASMNAQEQAPLTAVLAAGISHL
jgi:hypothetical protein